MGGITQATLRGRVGALATGGMFAALSVVLLGAECSPTPRPCNNPGECEDGTEYPACIQYCVERLYRDDALGQTCVVDPCHPDLVQNGSAILCPDGLTCVSSDGVHGVCTDLRRPFLAACTPGPFNECATGLFCRPFEDTGCEGGIQRPEGSYYASAGGVCSTPIREGGFCDANWVRRAAAYASPVPCAAPTHCARIASDAAARVT